MRISRRFLIGAGGALLLLLALAAVSGSSQAVDNSSRVDAGPSIEVRVNEAFNVVIGAYYEDPPAVEANSFFWDTDNRTDTNPHDGILNNDEDVYGATFPFAGFDRVGTWAFTVWVNYSDGRLVNASRVITVVENQPPVIVVGQNPQGVTGTPVTFAVTVNDPDSNEVDLVWEWDFDVGFDSDGNGVPDDDIDSTAKINVVHTYTAEGTYAAKLTVRDDYGDETVAYINAIITRPPGVCEREVSETTVGTSFTENVTVRKLCWASYHLKVTAGRHYTYTIEVTNGVPVFVMVQFGKEQYETYKARGSTQAFVGEWSTVPERVNSTSVTFVPDKDGIAYITIDNGYLYQINPLDHESSVVITVQDADRNNLLANIPFWVYIVAVIGVVAVAGFFMARAYMTTSEIRKQEKAKRAVEQQEKAHAKNELDAFLSNPEQALQKKTAPPPPPPPMAMAPGPAPQAGPRAGPRPSGPQAPAGYVPPAPQPAPAPAPAAAPAYGPRPAAGPQPAPAIPAVCPSCQTPTEPGWTACPNCGADL